MSLDWNIGDINGGGVMVHDLTRHEKDALDTWLTTEPEVEEHDYLQALTMALFAIEDLMHPERWNNGQLTPEDLQSYWEQHGPGAIEALYALREQLRETT